MNNQIVNNVKKLDNIVLVCFGQPEGDELPQVVTPDEMIIDLVHSATGKATDLIDAELHNQITPYYDEGDQNE